jgi:hypothetical protein
MSPAIHLHHFRVIRLVAFWVQSHIHTVFVELGNFRPTRPRVQQIVKPPSHITSSLIIYWLLKAQRKDIRQADLIFVLPADLQRHLAVNHAKLEDILAFATVKKWNVVQTRIRVDVEQYQTFFVSDVSLNVHLSTTLANDRLDAQILIHLLQSSICTCFEQYLAHPQEVKFY